MKLKPNIATSENGFIFNPATGDSFMANVMASEIVNHLKKEKSIPEIRLLLLEKYDVEQQQLDRDLDDLLQQLKEANLLD
ncbi:PqqD family peptide modification chaperone [Hufsiella ginkgonis]|uniref:PqqD family peptide modification chaperone n=1 Tax=Hufsiella ginkgonis TaxID=2695274 RepID=A0A7K1Y0Z3_9SPHI|nr:PqqD family peptide modification chaperone [Hufsiella ginkgonis]MXV16913.1 PqqD family peptide modification chaperone [Hufsiella ginkgonis]